MFDPAGRWLGEVEVPDAFQLHEVGPDCVLGVWRDELDVETVRRDSLIQYG